MICESVPSPPLKVKGKGTAFASSVSSPMRSRSSPSPPSTTTLSWAASGTDCVIAGEEFQSVALAYPAPAGEWLRNPPEIPICRRSSPLSPLMCTALPLTSPVHAACAGAATARRATRAVRTNMGKRMRQASPACASAAIRLSDADAAPQPYQQNDGKGFVNIAPPGANGFATIGQIGQFLGSPEGNRAYPPY